MVQVVRLLKAKANNSSCLIVPNIMTMQSGAKMGIYSHQLTVTNPDSAPLTSIIRFVTKPDSGTETW